MSGNTPSLPRLGFDVVVDRIAALYSSHSTADGAVKLVSRMVKTSYIKAAGKRKVAETPVAVAPQRKRRAVAVTPALSDCGPLLSTPCPPRSVDCPDYRHLYDSSNTGASLIDGRCDIVSHHVQHRPSVLQCIYKRLPPSAIVRLSPGDEVIIVLPAVSSRLSSRGLEVNAHYRKLFSGVLGRTLAAVHPSDRSIIVADTIRDKHTFLRANSRLLEFSCRTKNYPLREHLEVVTSDEATINRLCDQGAGIELSVCGYTTQQTVLLQLRYIPYVEVYKRAPPETFLNEHITFSNRVRQVSSLDDPLLRQISLYDGCSHSTLEILWKYYRVCLSINQASAARLARVARDAASSSSTTLDSARASDPLSTLTTTTKTTVLMGAPTTSKTAVAGPGRR